MKKLIGKAFEKTFGNEKKNEKSEQVKKQHKRFKTLHAKPQNSSKERGSVQYTGKYLLMLHIPHTMVNAKCTYRIYEFTQIEMIQYYLKMLEIQKLLLA